MAEQGQVTRKQYTRGRELMLKLCKAFKIDPRNVQTITIVASFDDVVHIQVGRLLEEGELASINWEDLNEGDFTNG